MLSNLKRTISVIIAISSITCTTFLGARQIIQSDNKLDVYGNDTKHGAFADINGVKIYYEIYGKGDPLLLIHGNGQAIADMKHQVEFFKNKYMVIVADSRGHGKSELGTTALTYEQMTDDYEKLLGKLKINKVNIIGWSDGGIIGMILGFKHPEKVGKLAIMGANLNPSGAHKWAIDWVAKNIVAVNAMIDKNNNKNEHFKRIKQALELIVNQPNISKDDLHKITAPTLVMTGDKDAVRLEHTIEIFENIPSAHLCVFPGATHMIPEMDPKLFNETVSIFLTNKFTRPDTKDLFQ